MELRAYQQEDVDKLIRLKTAGLFNEQRTGKTPTALQAMAQAHVERLLIICPASLSYVWKQEYEQWVGGRVYVPTDTKITVLPDVDVLVINYEKLRTQTNRAGLLDLVLKWKPTGLIVDESHRCKNRKKQNYSAVMKLSRRIERRIYCTGTPAPNKQDEIWAQLSMIHPDVYTSYWRFIDDYFTVTMIPLRTRTIRNVIGIRPECEDKLQQLLDSISCNRKRKDVMRWLPKEEAPIQVKLPCTKQQLKYLKELEETFETGDVVTQGVLDRLIRIRQICTDPGILNLKGKSPKTEWILSYLKDYPEKQVLIFSLSRKYLERLITKLLPSECALIVGGTPAKQRAKIVQDFQAAKLKVLLLQTQACKEGLTLDSADCTIFVDNYPPAADYRQAKDRMVDTTPEHVKPKQIIHLMMDGTYDEVLYTLVEHNVEVTNVINDYKNYLRRKRHGNSTS